MQIDATLKFLKSPAQLPSSGLLRTGGSGKHYENVVLYGHSTGGLVATLYGAEYGGGWRGAIDGYIFNSPFLRWNVEMYQRVLYVSPCLMFASTLSLWRWGEVGGSGSGSARLRGAKEGGRRIALNARPAS